MAPQQLELQSTTEDASDLTLNIETLQDLDASLSEAVRGGGVVVGGGPVLSPSTAPVLSGTSVIIVTRQNPSGG